MKSQIKLGRWFGVEVGLHVSWLIIAYLITLSVAQDFRAHNPDWGPLVVWGTALATAALFFVTLIVHELAHSLVAIAHGIPVKAITLFALGGVSQIEKDSESAKTEFLIAIAGPLTSLAIGAACLWLPRALGRASGMSHSPPLALLFWLGYINLGLAFFNLVPGFPLDGGRVLRALIWWKTGDAVRSTRSAVLVGHWIAMALVVWGVFQFFHGAGINGLWLVFIGWFLNQAGQATTLKAEWDAALKGLKVEDVMLSDCPVVPSEATVDAFVHESLLRTGRRCFLVGESGRNVGILTAEDVKHVDKARWAATPVGQAMRPFERIPQVPAGESAKTALERMLRENAEQLAVVSAGRVEGIVTRGHILELLHAQMDMKA